MTSTVRHVAIIVAVATIVFFSNLGGPRLWDRDEPRNAGCTAEMLARGDLITPVFDGELRAHKPILLYWFMMTAYSMFGINEFAARFWSALLATGTGCITYGIGRRLFSARVGLWAAVILMTTLMFGVAARAATPDSLLIFWSTAALLVYVRGTFPANAAGHCAAGPVRYFPRWSQAVLMYALMGMGVLAKGPVGLVLPTAVIGMYLLVWRLPPRTSSPKSAGARIADGLYRLGRPFAPRHFVQTCWLMRPVTALVVIAAVALPWYVAVALRTDGQWVREFLLDHNLGRAAQSLEGHSGSLLFYPLALLVGFFPWSVFAAPTLQEWFRRLRSGDGQSAGLVLAACWIGVYLGLFSLAKTKLPSYITPCYPAVALLVAVVLVAWTEARAFSASFWPPAALACLGIVGMLLALAVPWAASKYVPGEEWLALLGCIPMLTAVAAYGFLRSNARSKTITVFGIGAVLFTTALLALGTRCVDRHQTFDAFVAAAFARSEDPRIGTLGVLEPSWVFYTQRPLDHLFAPELTAEADDATPVLGQPRTKDWQLKPLLNAWHYLDSGADHFVITTASQLRQIGTLPVDVEVIARAPYFLRSDELVLLAPRPRVARSPTNHPPADRR